MHVTMKAKMNSKMKKCAGCLVIDTQQSCFKKRLNQFHSADKVTETDLWSIHQVYHLCSEQFGKSWNIIIVVTTGTFHCSICSLLDMGWEVARLKFQCSKGLKIDLQVLKYLVQFYLIAIVTVMMAIESLLFGVVSFKFFTPIKCCKGL